MSSPNTTEGEITFNAPGTSQPSKTWYRVVGTLDTPPLIVLHGGPGAGHEYMTPLLILYEQYKIPIIFYDQIGYGRSTHFREKNGNAEFWTFGLFIQKLQNLVAHFNLHQLGFSILGQSWGGMLGGAFASLQPQGLKKLVLAGAPTSIPLYAQGCRYLLSQLPKDVRQTIEECEKRGDFKSPEYEAASGVFYGRHFCRIDPLPETVLAALHHLKEDSSAYLTI
ncbi:alpha/beta-hydrolase [Xylariaceae sp. FL0662B]|nr:alpha/beta-hydrolase [Xylariaceae sp. FL0662B]